MKFIRTIKLFSLLLLACTESDNQYNLIDRAAYLNKLEGFWLAQNIGNWTGRITEMDKIGIPVNGKAGGFYTRENWGKKDAPNLWGSENFSDVITFLYAKKDSIWGADDDTDIEYIYQELLLNSPTLDLSGEQIRSAWLAHIYDEEENFLWVSNQKAFDLMQDGFVPPDTSDPTLNPYYEMIDAQLTTEIFGLFAPAQAKIALELAYLPIRTTARKNAALISEFYIIMHSLASVKTNHHTLKNKLFWMAKEARNHLPESSYASKMFDFVWENYQHGISWEKARDLLHEKYQIRQEDNYNWSSIDKDCHGCFAAGINFGASMISLFYGEGDLKKTIKIGTLVGWDSDNPTATWSGLLGFMLGKKKVEEIFNLKFSELYNIHRTRRGFSNNGVDNFKSMAIKGQSIVDRVVLNKMGGTIDYQRDLWLIPKKGENKKMKYKLE